MIKFENKLVSTPIGIVYDKETKTIQNCIYQEECEHHEKWELVK